MADRIVSGRTFEQWKREVNQNLAKRTSMVADDLGDVDYYSFWADGLEPSEAADEAIEANGYDPEEFGEEIF